MFPKAAKTALVLLIFVSAGFAQQKKPSEPQWKKYAYPEDGFSISAPAPPDIHEDEEHADEKVYRWNIAADVSFIIRAGVDQNCKQLMDRAKGRSPDESLVKISLNGYPGLEVTTIDREGQKNRVTRIYCVKEKTYEILTSEYPLSQKRPVAIDRMFHSFRLIAK